MAVAVIRVPIAGVTAALVASITAVLIPPAVALLVALEVPFRVSMAAMFAMGRQMAPVPVVWIVTVVHMAVELPRPDETTVPRR